MNWRLGLVFAVLLGGCTTPPAPVVDRSHSPSSTALEANGQYRVRKGDSLYAIAFRFGLDHRDLAVWNDIRPPYTIYPDQLLQMEARASASRPVTSNADAASNTPKAPATSTNANRSLPPRSDPARSQPAKPVPPPPQSPVPTRPSATPGNSLSWQWPVKGQVVRNYLANDPSRNGLDISGAEGQAVVSTAGGTVVYSGAGLIGYGELIIIKHNEEFLSAYAHNRKRLVEEGAVVSAGQKIAEMGKNDRNETVLHFEIRVNGRPVDPRKYLSPP